MRIDRLDLLSYGHLREHTLDLSLPSAGLTLVVGPNEAGKSTTLRAIRALLFGIERGTPDDYRMGRESLRVGAALRDGDGAVLEVIRQGLSKAPLVTPAGERLDEEVLAALVGGVERALFATLFCIDHDELHDRSADLLDPEAEIGRLVFGASLGAAPLTRVLKDLEAQAGELYKPRGQVQFVAKTLKQARELAREMRQIRVRSRDWEEADGELKRLDAEAQGLRAKAGLLRAEESQVERLISTLPVMARRATVLDAMGDLELEGSVQTPDWAQAVGQTSESLGTAEQEHGRAVTARDTLHDRLRGMPSSSPLLVAADRIDALLEGIGRFRKDRDDLPGLQGQLAESHGTLARLLERLGMDESRARGATDAQLIVVEDLVQARTAFDAQLVSARVELEALVDSIGKAQRELQELPEAPDVEALAQVAAVGRSFLERERQAGKERGEIGGLDGDISVQAHRLQLQGVELDALERLPAPTLVSLRDHRQSRTRLESRSAGLEQRVADIESQESDVTAQLADIQSDSSVPNPGDVEAARGRRDEGWTLVRAAWMDGDVDDAAVKDWAGDSPLADAFEGSIHHADHQDDARYQHVTQLALLEQLAATLAELADRTSRCGAEQDEIVEAGARLDAEWRALWEPVGVCPDGVDAGEEWLKDLDELQRIAAERRRRAVALGELEKELAAQCAAVSTALREIGVPPGAGSLALLIEQADAAIQAAREAAEERKTASRAIAQGERDKPRRQEAVRTAELGLGEWERDWAAALTPLGMTATTSIAAGRETLRLLREYREEVSNAASLRGRVEGVKTDIDTYAGRVTKLLEEVSPELVRLDADRALSELKPKLDEARKESRLREELVSQMDAAESQVADGEQALRDARDALSRLRQQAELGDEVDLTVEAQRAAAHGGLAESVRVLEEDLVERSGMALKDLLAALGDSPTREGELMSRLAEVQAEIEDVEQRLEDVNRKVGDARTTLSSLDHQGKAAELEQESELEFAALAEHVSEYARVALAAEVLRRVVADYGQRNQGPIVEFASRNFSTLTDGAFEGLLTDLDGDKQVLLAKRLNGEFLHTAELSEGTVDQLYLALRLAGIEHHLARAAASPPIILDDILVNFDNDRAAAALRLFAELGSRAQVLLFTHHRHVIDLAQKVLPAEQIHVAELSARDHSAVFAAPERPPARSANRAGARIAAGETAQAAIVGVLDDAGAPLGKAEIVERTGITDSAWTPAIRALVERGSVIQEGAKRGAKYSLGA